MACIVWQTGFAGLDDRAQSWKAHRVVGSASLSFGQIHSIVMPSADSESFREALLDLTELYLLRYGDEVGLIKNREHRSPKNSLSFVRDASMAPLGSYSIHRDRTRLIIRSSSEAGWINAIYAMADEVLGVRWYWPGDLGLEWVGSERSRFTYRPWRDSPAFIHRQLRHVDDVYMRRNRLNAVYKFQHNLGYVFGPEVYESHPEAFSVINGQRKVPRGHNGTDPQPNFTSAVAVEIAAKAALDYFVAQPERASFSLSINDNVLFDTAEDTVSIVSPIEYFRGRPNYTNLVFGYMNRVAEKVFDEGGAWDTPAGEPRYLTAYAYYWTEAAPSIEIHPRVMPVLTADRAQWHDPDFQAEDKTLLQEWLASGAERVGIYDYYYGFPYIYPRQFNRWISKSLSHVSEEGVDVFFSHLPAFWGLDGAKAWLTSQLLWDPSQEADILLDEYYQSFFGPAAESMYKFYETAEEHRNENEGPAEWIKLYKDESAIALFTPEVLEEMRNLIDEAEAASFGDARRSERVAVVSRAFRLTELYAKYWAARRDLVLACLDQKDVTVIADQLSIFREARNTYNDYAASYIGSSEYAPRRKDIALSQSNPEHIAEAILNGTQGRFRSLVQDSALKHNSYQMRNFLGPELPSLSDWHLDYRPSEKLRIRTSKRSERADSGLRIEGADIISVFNEFPAFADTNYELRLEASWQVSLDNRISLNVQWLDYDGNLIRSEVPIRLPIEHRAEPSEIRVPLKAPANTYDLRIRLVVSRQYPGDYLDISEVDLGEIN